jgi:hypothetical protein
MMPFMRAKPCLADGAQVPAMLLLALPPKNLPGLVKPDQDIYYAAFVALVILAAIVGAVIFYRRGSGR